MIHDSLVVKGQAQEYSKYMSRTMAISLIANALLVTLVPMTYKFNPTYPFILGTVAYLLLFASTLFMQDVKRTIKVAKLKLPDLRKIVGKRHLLLFGLTFGIVSALFTAPSDMFNIALKDYGIRADLIGWVYGIGSLVGAAIGPFFHYLRKIRLSQYLLINLVSLLLTYFAAFSHNYVFLAVSIIIGISFWRYRRIIYQNYLLTIYPGDYKATLVSAMNNLEELNTIWLPVAIATSVSLLGLPIGLGLISIFGLAIAPVFYYSTLRFFRRYPLPKILANPTSDIV
jgi:hypothetical protein